MAEDPFDSGFWDGLAETPADAEAVGIAAGDPWAVTKVAGLQYHHWLKDDGLDGRHEPRPGDRLQLVREPTNPHDGNAVRVEWRNAVMLGHLPRGVAASVAVALDAGESLRAYVLDLGEADPFCRAWELRALLVGAPLTGLHANWMESAAYRQSVRIWPDGREPTPAQDDAAAAWQDEQARRRRRRQADVTYALALAEQPARALLPEEAEAPPDPEARGHVFGWWDQVPPGLMTATTLRKYGLRPADKAGYAFIEYGSGKRYRYHVLHAVSEARPCASRSPAQRAAAAAAGAMRQGRTTSRRWHHDDHA